MRKPKEVLFDGNLVDLPPFGFVISLNEDLKIGHDLKLLPSHAKVYAFVGANNVGMEGRITFSC